jgi:alanine racemase
MMRAFDAAVAADRASIPLAASGVITIDLGRLGANWRALAALVAPAECGAVVKADAYGLGADKVIPTLAAAGCRTFFVATTPEAAAARALAPAAPLYVLNGFAPECARDVVALGARPVLSSLEEAIEWVDATARGGRSAPAALHLDSGLHRLGMTASEISMLVANPALLRKLDLRLVMSHLACADDPAHPLNAEQVAAFRASLAHFTGVPRSLAASDGLMLGPEYHFDLVRPGYALYGGQPSRAARAPVGPVVSVEARVLQVHDVPEGATVGYGATWRARRPSRIATIAAGYADGFARALGTSGGDASGFVAVRGQRVPVVGRVSMDLITVDVTDAPGRPPARGDLVELVGPHVTLEEMGAAAGTIGYEVLTRLGRRFHRVYTGGVN